MQISKLLGGGGEGKKGLLTEVTMKLPPYTIVTETPAPTEPPPGLHCPPLDRALPNL